jgi:DNA polymerase delta subunit 2
VAKILELEEGKEVAVVGTVYKQMKLKPSILEEYLRERGARGALAPATSFCSEDDSVVLEDEGARMVLRGDALPVQRLVTGAALGTRCRCCVCHTWLQSVR